MLGFRTLVPRSAIGHACDPRPARRSTQPSSDRLTPETARRRPVDRADAARRRLRNDGPTERHAVAPARQRPGHPGPEQRTLRADRLPGRGRCAVCREGRPGRAARSVSRRAQADQRPGAGDRRVRAVPGGCRVPEQDRRAGLRDQRHVPGSSRISSRDGATDQPIVTEVERHGPVSARTLGSRRGGQPGPQRRVLGHGGAQRAADRPLARWRGAAPRRAAGRHGRRDRHARCRRRGERRVGRQPAARHARQGSTSSTSASRRFAPFDDERVRRAIALGIDRRPIVERFFPPGLEVASHYSPCTIPNGCAGARLARLRPAAGQGAACGGRLPERVRDDDPLPRGAPAVPARPDRDRDRATGAALANLGITAELAVVPEDTFDADLEAGKLDGIHLARRRACRTPTPAAILDPHFAPTLEASSASRSTDWPRRSRPVARRPTSGPAWRPTPRRTTRSAPTSR